MAWKKETAEDIIGMSAEDLKAKLAKIEAFESQFGDLKTLIEAQGSGINALSESMKDMKVASPYSGNGPAPNVTADPNAPIKLTEWGDDADKAFQERTQPIVQLALDTRGAIARNSVKDEMQAKYKDWHLFAEEIDKLAKDQPLQSKAQEGFWRNVYFSIKGQHAEEIAQDQINKKGKFYTETANSITMRKEEPKTPEEELTDDQRKFANKMGVSLADYAKYAQEQRVH